VNRAEAIKVAIKCMEKVKQREFAFDANLGRAIPDYIRGQKALAEYERIREAIKIVEGLK